MRELAERLLARERAAVSEALNCIDDQRPEARDRAIELLSTLELRGQADGALRVGVTGAPGAGKSTLLDACVRQLREDDTTVGIIAVDPSSQRNATHASVEVLAVVFDIVFVETVGVGQSEADVARQVDTTVYVAQPGAGDMLQFMKAGVLELPDVFFVNKADTGPAAERTASELRAGLGLGERKTAEWEPPLLLGSARDGVGVSELLDTIRAHRTLLDRTRQLVPARRRARAAYVEQALLRRYGTFGAARIGGPEGIRARVEASTGRSVFELLGVLSREIEGTA
jgi:LAO/AO transport system kinase